MRHGAADPVAMGTVSAYKSVKNGFYISLLSKYGAPPYAA
jgi:hypothetical protein